MSSFKLNDEQSKAARTLRGQVVITAGAGSGKTRVLTERTANAVIADAVPGWRPLGIDEILAITFTEKAAGELAERIRGALRSAGYMDEARRVDVSWISTIHGMCARILRAEALTLGIDPGFRILEGVEVARIRLDCLESTLSNAFQRSEDTRRLLEMYGFEKIDGAVTRLARFMDTHDLSPDDFRGKEAESATSLLGEVLAFLADIDHSIKQCDPEGSGVAEHASACADTLGVLRALGDAGLDDGQLAEEIMRALNEHRSPGKYAGVKQPRSALKEHLPEFARRAAAIRCAPLERELLTLADSFRTRFSDAKRSRAGLDFDDLELYTRKALRDEAVARRWRGRFRLTLVDEFQDTSALQLEIVRILGGQNLCTVGDARQSIYRFRGADVDVFQGHVDAMSGGGVEPIELRVNYRSHADVLGFVNRVFGHPDMFGDELVELACGRSEDGDIGLPEGDPRVELRIDVTEGIGTGSRQRQAGILAERLRELHVAHGVALSKMVVLLRTYTHADDYAEALRAAGLESVVLGGNRFLDIPEVLAVRAAMRLLANRTDDGALKMVAISPLCDLSDDGLLELSAEARLRGVPMYEALDSARLVGVDRLRADALKRGLEDARDGLGVRSLGEVLLRLVERCGVDLKLVAGGIEGSQKYAALLKLARMADAFEQASGGGIAGFSAYLDDKQRFGDYEKPASLVGDGSEAVRIMSIHASKGLEFPVVAVAEAGATGLADSSIAHWTRSPEPSLSLRLPSESRGSRVVRASAESDHLRGLEQAAEVEELKRVFYVACTRARDHLIIVGARSVDSRATTMLNMLVDALSLPLGEERDEVVTLGDALSVRCVISRAASEESGSKALPKPTPVEPEQAQSWFAEAAATRPAEQPTHPLVLRRMSYSTLSRYRSCPCRFGVESSVGHLAARDRGEAATRLGSAVHAALELFGEDQPLDDARIEALCRYNELDEQQAQRVRRALDRYRTSSLARAVCEMPMRRREAAFGLRLETGDAGSFVLDGKIDVYARDGQRALVVDYKTGLGHLSADEMRARYGLQAECYALAALHDGVTEVEVAFVRPEVDSGPEPDTVSFGYTSLDRAGIEESVRAVWRAVRDGVFDPLPEWDPETCGACVVPATMCTTKAAVTFAGEGQEPDL